jgi:hypothetical protein
MAYERLDEALRQLKTDRARAEAQVFLKAEKQRVERLLAAGQQGVVVSALGCALTIDGTGREFVTLQHGDVIKKLGERPGCGQTAHAGADHNGVSADHGSTCHHAPRRSEGPGEP